MNRTKIVCTVGPATRSPEMLRMLFDAGMNVARLNFSHGTREEHGEVIDRLRRIGEEGGRSLAILQDLAGPKIRIGPIAKGSVDLEPGDALVLTARDVPGDGREVSLTYKELPGDVRPGDSLLLSDGQIELVVEETRAPDIRCRVVIGGPLSSHKGINLPARSVHAPILSDKDRADLAFGLGRGVDFVALSFVRSAKDVAEARCFMEEFGRSAPIIAKIEKHEAVDRMHEIVGAVEAVMIARGDLGVEIPIERVPRVQKDLIAEANRAGKPVITATQMLRSMVESPRPTRAEVTDVANAILDGSDGVMLSEETAVGRYPAEAVAMMAKIAAETERYFPYDTWAVRYGDAPGVTVEEAVAHSACEMASRIGAAAIVTWTGSGSTTRLVAKHRPRQPVLAVTPDEETYRRLALIWGVVPVCIPRGGSDGDWRAEAVRVARESGLVRSGEPVVVTAGLPLHVPGTTNLIHVAKA
ncbi:MAG: pyruvate kinase [Candidatus Eisenbacteria bacterium]